jgi:hypothetical protein
MVSFIRGYIERQSGAARGRAPEAEQLAFDTVQRRTLGLVEAFPSSDWKESPVTLARRY